MSAYKRAVAVAAIATIAGIAHWASAQVSPKKSDPTMKEVSYADIGFEVQILSELGQPLGKIVSIRGRWRERPESKDQELGFRVSQINGRAADRDVELLAVNVRPLLLRGMKDAAQTPGNWDWSAAWKEHREPPKPAPGEEWEMKIVSEGGIVGFPMEVQEELGRAGAQMPYLGFVPVHYFISVRKIKADGK
jgi:hypothetical protein